MIIKDCAHLFHGFLGDIACNPYPSYIIDELLRFLDDVLVLVQDITEILVRFFEAVVALVVLERKLLKKLHILKKCIIFAAEMKKILG